MVSSTPRPHFTPGKEPVPILQEGGLRAGLDGRKMLVPTEIRSLTVLPVVSHYTDRATRPTRLPPTHTAKRTPIQSAYIFHIRHGRTARDASSVSVSRIQEINRAGLDPLPNAPDRELNPCHMTQTIQLNLPYRD